MLARHKLFLSIIQWNVSKPLLIYIGICLFVILGSQLALKGRDSIETMQYQILLYHISTQKENELFLAV